MTIPLLAPGTGPTGMRGRSGMGRQIMLGSESCCSHRGLTSRFERPRTYRKEHRSVGSTSVRDFPPIAGDCLPLRRAGWTARAKAGRRPMRSAGRRRAAAPRLGLCGERQEEARRAPRPSRDWASVSVHRPAGERKAILPGVAAEAGACTGSTKKSAGPREWPRSGPHGRRQTAARSERRSHGAAVGEPSHR
jgi:hypothetical protein